MIDKHCFDIFVLWQKGEISKEEAENRMNEHENTLILKMLENSFTTTYPYET